MFYYLIRKLLFLIDPEKSHIFILKCLNFKFFQLFNKIFSKKNQKSKKIKCMGLIFKNKLGTAAGIDKNGEYINCLSKLGFGFIEVGTVTPLPQNGHPKPRLFRITPMEGIINRMGFNNLGIDNLILNIKKSHFKGIIGVNIGKNQNTSIKNSINDYLICIEKIYLYASYIAINISSPNTTNLRNLQYGTILKHLLYTIKEKQKELHKKHLKYVPIAIKISPDLSIKELKNISKQFIKYKIDAVIATNTTLDHSSVLSLKNGSQIGGLSGLPLQKKSTNIISILSKNLGEKIPIIGVGGINSIHSAKEKIKSGATLIQIYSGLIYHGPDLIKKIIKSL
ncbi:quinone-dependent dihydroorotate dehydrogenase [Buchnera aphidicola]|uniref:Dihydroorotate dehydrogenase (quinone) n=1 Tax=Buchnera aphidicola str. USDA (Myzus persicae) TaxID=1009856 RepID=W0NZT8_BUCMP|nr:quinone-dependent dihydroorotate dehydrogenase [Buchnera aphidicola]AHG60026.1 Pyrd [Buchnera aphidicola str. USDA (Myzus persicae)]AHG60606.1 Pyrd [Buchnera aphidicola str. W106 (Myzus persicae)]AHG61178.1 Pyrd [Buchnera aphidicola str. G002 (Myzus persicae)]AHG61751.1 Pyrd [Buchnera aphidicola str. F009 (Myzus persicae)]WAI03289.1 MAG: quinone-dependent dihydroorotate dehydrogenase [Buchnera aphidicola (Myzus persicae)]